jgi:hypothetical protein
MRFYYSEEELDVFLNGELLQTFEKAHDLPYQLIELLKKLGYKTFEKQSFKSR